MVVLRNVAQTTNHWLGIDLVGRKYRDVVGAKLTLDVGGRQLTRFAQGGGSYLSSSDRRHIFGLGQADRVGRLTVAWPGGKEEHWDGLAVDRYWRLEEGQAHKATRGERREESRAVSRWLCGPLSPGPLPQRGE